MSAHFIDVDQGAAALLEFPCGAVLVDAGGRGNEDEDDDSGVVGDRLITYLDSFFARRSDLDRRLAAVFITHAHIDHNRYLRRVVRRYRIGGYVHNGTTGAPNSGYRNAGWMVNYAPTASPAIPLRAVSEAEVAAAGPRGVSDARIDPLSCNGVDPRIAVLSAKRSENPGWSADDWRDDNNHSLVIRVDYGQSSLLIIGDLETPAINMLVNRYRGTRRLDVDVFAVGHHGSANGTTGALLEAMSPEIAVMSVGPANIRGEWTAWEHGHPRRSVVELLDRYITRRRSDPDEVMVADGQRRFSNYSLRDAIYATGWDGHVIVTGDSRGAFTVSTSR